MEFIIVPVVNPDGYAVSILATHSILMECNYILDLLHVQMYVVDYNSSNYVIIK